MGKRILGQFSKPTLGIIKRLFDEPELVSTVTYTLYQGRTEDGPQTTTFDLPIIWLKDEIGTVEQEGATIQQRIREALLRSSDLPTGVAVKNLSINDRITDGDAEYAFSSMNKALGFVVHIGCLGDQ